jgi:hypothetical protein
MKTIILRDSNINISVEFVTDKIVGWQHYPSSKRFVLDVFTVNGEFSFSGSEEEINVMDQLLHDAV